MSKNSDITAFRDWWNADHYNKNDIFSFVSKINQGYEPYELSILNGVRNGSAIIEGKTSNLKYEIDLDSEGNNNHNLYFFQNGGENIEVISGEDSSVKILNSRTMTIDLAPAYEETILWDYINDNSGNFDYNSTTEYTMHDTINNYDYIILETISYSGDPSNSRWSSSELVYKYLVEGLNNFKNPNHLFLWTFYDRTSHYYINDNKFKRIYNNVSNINAIVKIIGIKNPYTKTILWDYVNDNSNQILYGNSATLTLSDSVDNYDELWIETSSWYQDPGSANWDCYNLNGFSIQAIKNSKYKNNYFFITTHDTRTSVYSFSGATFNIIRKTNNLTTINGLVRIYGIKH